MPRFNRFNSWNSCQITEHTPFLSKQFAILEFLFHTLVGAAIVSNMQEPTEYNIATVFGCKTSI